MGSRTEDPQAGNLGGEAATSVRTVLNPPAADAWLGRVVSHYRLEERLGAGGMGVVYRATDLKLGRPVAIKFLSAHLATDQAAQARFLQEARSASALDHPNIGTIYDLGEQNDELFIVMALYQGQTLGERLKSGRLAVEEVLSILRQVLLGLAAAHRAGIVHRDIKPPNLFITREGTVKTLDFGLAKLVSETQGQTQAGQALGTVLYMSPEQLRGEPVDSRADLWSFGVVAYEALAGASPFQADSSAATATKILHQQPPPLASVPGVPNWLAELVSQLLRKNPSERPESASEVLERFDHPVPSKLVTTPRQRGQEWVLQPKRRLLAVLTGAFLAMGAIGLYWYFHSGALRTGRQVKSLAVLPFVNVSENPDIEYLSDGLAETLIDNLSQIPELQVIARTTAFRYKGKELDLPKLQRELSVDAVLTGRVQQRGDTLVVHADLVNVGTGSQLWGEKYNRKLTDLLVVETGIAKAISDKLRPRLSAEVQQRVTGLHTENLEAYQLYLRGRYEWNKRTAEGFKKSIEYFNQAIEKDPAYALAYAGLADSYSIAGYGLGLSPNELFPPAKAAASKAVELDDALAEAHSALAAVKSHDWDWPSAEREFRRAIQLNAGYPTAHFFYASMYLLPMGQFEETIAELKKAVALDPFSETINTNLGRALYFARRYDEAIAQYKRVLEMDPKFARADARLAEAYEQIGKYEEAITEWGKVPPLTPNYLEPEQLAQVKQALTVSGANGYWRKRLEFLKNRAQRTYVPPSVIAIACARAGNNDEAFAWLEKAYQNRDVSLPFLKVEPAVDSLRSDPRYADLLRRLGLPL
jgi:serine/threonine-protein kinase